MVRELLYAGAWWFRARLKFRAREDGGESGGLERARSGGVGIPTSGHRLRRGPRGPAPRGRDGVPPREARGGGAGGDRERRAARGEWSADRATRGRRRWAGDRARAVRDRARDAAAPRGVGAVARDVARADRDRDRDRLRAVGRGREPAVAAPARAGGGRRGCVRPHADHARVVRAVDRARARAGRHTGTVARDPGAVLSRDDRVRVRGLARAVLRRCGGPRGRARALGRDRRSDAARGDRGGRIEDARDRTDRREGGARAEEPARRDQGAVAARGWRRAEPQGGGAARRGARRDRSDGRHRARLPRVRTTARGARARGARRARDRERGDHGARRTSRRRRRDARGERTGVHRRRRRAPAARSDVQPRRQRARGVTTRRHGDDRDRLPARCDRDRDRRHRDGDPEAHRRARGDTVRDHEDRGHRARARDRARGRSRSTAAGSRSHPRAGGGTRAELTLPRRGVA